MGKIGYFQFTTFHEFNRWNDAKKFEIINIESLKILGATTFRAWFIIEPEGLKMSGIKDHVFQEGITDLHKILAENAELKKEVERLKSELPMYHWPKFKIVKLMSKEKENLTDAKLALVKAREYLDNDIATLECESRVRTMFEATWEDGMALRDVIDILLLKLKGGG